MMVSLVKYEYKTLKIKLKKHAYYESGTYIHRQHSAGRANLDNQWISSIGENRIRYIAMEN